LNGQSNSASSNGQQQQQQQQQSVTIDHCFRCPICRETIIIPRLGGINSLPPSFIVNQLLDLVKTQRRDMVPRCQNHTNEELLFCETCDKAFCSICESHCRVTSNADHIVIPFSIAIKRMTEIFLFKSHQCVNGCNLALNSVQREIEYLGASVDEVVQAVDDSYNEIKQILDKKREETLKSLVRLKESKERVLTEQIQLIRNEKQKIEYQCKEYQQSQIECRFLSAQIETLSEKLDCLRALSEPRENSFIK
jgi:tripartite motif-containing protein 2/3